MIGYVALAIGLLIGARIMWGIDDWRRDFTTNFAETSADAKDPLLRPLTLEGNVKASVAIVREAGESLPRWRLVEEARDATGRQLHFVRTTPLVRFKDDVRVQIAPHESGSSIVEVTSQSRVGRGDLGQNPRNIKELVQAIRLKAER